MLVSCRAWQLKLATGGPKEAECYCSGNVDGDDDGLSARSDEYCFDMVSALIVFTLD